MRWVRAVFLIISLAIFWRIFFLWTSKAIGSQYDFLPYNLKIYPGTIGDGSRGMASPVAVHIVNTSHPVVTSPIKLRDEDLGWAGDFVAEYDKEYWHVIACAGDTVFPAVLECEYGKGRIVYVSNSLTPYPNLVYNIFKWHIGCRPMTSLNVAVMVDVPPLQSTESWRECFATVNKISGYSNMTISEKYISSFNLNYDTLKNYDVLVLMMRWGDGYSLEIGGFHNERRSKAMLQFVHKGGLLLLPEAGINNQALFPYFTLLEFFRSEAFGFAMIVPCITSAVSMVTLIGRSERLSKFAFWVGILASAEILSANLWPITMALTRSVYEQAHVEVTAFLVSTAFLLFIVPWFMLGLIMVYAFARARR